MQDPRPVVAVVEQRVYWRTVRRCDIPSKVIFTNADGGVAQRGDCYWQLKRVFWCYVASTEKTVVPGRLACGVLLVELSADATSPIYLQA